MPYVFHHPQFITPNDTASFTTATLSVLIEIKGDMRRSFRHAERRFLKGGCIMSLSFPALQSLLPPQQVLFGDEQTHLLSLLAFSPTAGHPQLIAQEHLTGNEWRVLMALIDAYPGYASYAHLLALLTPCSLQANQKRLQEARAHGNDAMKQVLRPLRKVLAQMHPKLRRLGLMAASVQTLGYLLAAFDEGGDG
jgi:hypothetical protein